MATRFQPGQSGNPRGRPKGARNKGSIPDADRIWDLFIAEANRPLTITEAGKTVTIPMCQAAFRSLTHAAVKGEHRSQRLLTTLLAASEARHQALGREAFDTAIAYKRAWEQELDRRRTLGLAGADPVPHPDRRATRVVATDVVDRTDALEQAAVGRYATGGGLGSYVHIEQVSSADGELPCPATTPSVAAEADYTPDLARAVLQCISEGNPLQVACGPAGLPTLSNVRLWLVDQPEFLKTYRQACQSGFAAVQSDVAAVEENGAADTADARRTLARKWRTVEFPPEVDGTPDFPSPTTGGLDYSKLTHGERDQLLSLLEKAHALSEAVRLN